MTVDLGSYRMYLYPVWWYPDKKTQTTITTERYKMEKENYRTGEVTQLRRIADSLDEILRLIKADQKHNKEYMEKEKAHEGNFADGR